MATHSFPDDTWRAFLATDWRRTPRLFKRAADSVTTTEDLFDTLCELADDERGQLARSRALVSIQQRPQAPGDVTFLPCRDDGSWQGFRARIANQRPGQDYQLYVTDGLQRYCAAIWRRSRDFLAPLFECVGLPAGGVGIECFSGSYEVTQTGIHLDSADNFSFVIEGRKRMLFWPPDAFRARETNVYRSHQKSGISDYRAHQHSAIAIDAEAGDIIYWPQQYWHVAVSEAREWATTVNLAMWWTSPASLLLKKAVDRVLDSVDDISPESIDAPMRDVVATARSLPRSMVATLDEYRDVIASSTMDEAVQAAWSSLVTSGGFLVAPRPGVRRALGDGDQLCVDPRHPVVTIPLDDQRMDVVASGHVVETPAAPALVRLIADLNRGELLSVGAALQAFAAGSDPDRDQVRALLEHLESIQAVRRVEGLLGPPA
jgi:50S ribosomal protein L16 3-hydroxylase